MLTPSEYDHLCDQLMVIYNDLENSIINDMVRRITRMGRVSEATVWQAKQLQESGMLFDDILAEIAKRSDATENQVRALFQDAGIQSIQNDNYFYEQAGFGSITKLSPAAAQVLEAGYAKCSGELKNLTLTTAISSQQMYISACDSAYMQVSSGAMDYGTAIRRAVQAAADGGAYVWYPSGHKDRLDVAVRRSVLTGVGQTVRQLSVTNASDMGADLMEITAHAGARPEHAEWQGKLVSLSGKNAGRYIDGAKVYSLKEIGYGSGDGFGGWNCRHDWFPFFEGVSSRAYSDERLKELNAKNIEYDGKMYTEYEIDQMQRALERDIRNKKRSVSAANAGLDAAIDENVKKQMQGMFDAESVKLKEAEKKLKNFLEETGQLPDSTRVWVNGFDKSLSQKAVWANKNLLQKLDKNDIINIGNIQRKYNEYIQKYPDSDFNYFMVTYKLKEAGFKKVGIALPAKPKNALLENDPTPGNIEPSHIFKRMKERNITEADLKSFMNEANVMFVQWNGQRQTFRSEKGAVTITRYEDKWYYKTAWSKENFDDEEKNIREVIKRYVEP